MKLVLSHPTGNANVRAVAESLVKGNRLHQFYTSIAAYPGNFWQQIGRISALSEFRRRSFSPDLQAYTKLYPWREIGRAIALKFQLKKLIVHETGYFCVDKVYQSIDQHVANSLHKAVKNGAKAVYAYEDGALETFIEAKKLGLRCIYDLPIAYWETGRQLMMEEAIRLPQWAITLGGGIKDSPAKLERKTKELELADIVVGPGSFVMNSLPEWAKQKTKIVSPFGSPISQKPQKQHNDNRPLRVLFVGSMGQRKGLGDLFAAMNLLHSKNIELVVLGSLLAPMEFYRSEYSHFTYEKGRPHNDVLALMQSCDVFCLPSIVEGRALVMQEAMSQGLPIIITPNTGGDDLVIEGETGFLVPIRSPEAIAEKLLWFIENRSKIPQMGINAYIKSQTYTWEMYGNTISQNISTIIS